MIPAPFDHYEDENELNDVLEPTFCGYTCTEINRFRAEALTNERPNEQPILPNKER